MRDAIIAIAIVSALLAGCATDTRMARNPLCFQTVQHQVSIPDGYSGIDELDNTPEVLNRVTPEISTRFPHLFDRAAIREEIMVRALMLVGADGEVEDAKVVASNLPKINPIVIDALEQWSFAPPTRNGAPVRFYFYQTISISREARGNEDVQ